MKKQASKPTSKSAGKSSGKSVEPKEVPTTIDEAAVSESAATEANPEPAAKPKTRKKKADPEAESQVTPEAKPSPILIVEAKPEPTKTAKKFTGKAGGKANGKSAKSATAIAKPEFKQAIAAQLDAPKKLRKAKGRDLVVDEPGAEEVADVLGTSAEEVQEGADEIAGEIVGETKPVGGVGSGTATGEVKIERLQKILAKAGISSRRKAEELILGGRVQINGQVVKELGTKADMARDHVRVDGKLLQGAERIRYFVLNKPKGFVTTVSDPEGRPTVMEFFSSERERLYPVGRLDYLSEGLLLVTNDGELANKLTKAASGVEKTYLVKVAGQPTEDMLDVLRQGVVIERGRPGTNSGRVRTAPARIRQVRQGDNPWYEVVVIEGRNRELRKMFEEIGHHVEKIRRIGYGPLVLDQEPGKMRELEPEEVQALRLTADGKLKPKRRKGPAEAQLPTVAGKTVRYKKADGRPGFEPRRIRPEFQQESKSDAPASVRTAARESVRPAFKAGFKAASKPDLKPGFKAGFKSDFKTGVKPAGRSEAKPFSPRSGDRSNSRPDSRPGNRPHARPDYRDQKSEFQPGGRTSFKLGDRPTGRPAFPAKARRPEPPVTEFVLPPRKPQPEGWDETPSKDFNPDYKPGFKKGGFSKPAFRKDSPPKRFGGRPGSDRFDETGASTAPPFKTSDSGDRFAKPKFEKSGFTRPGGDREAYPDAPAEKRVKLGIEPIMERAKEPRGKLQFDRPRSGFTGGATPLRPASARPGSDRAGSERPSSRPGSKPGPERANSGRPSRNRAGFTSRPRADRPQSDRTPSDRTALGGRPFQPKGEGSSDRASRGKFRPRQAGPGASGERSGSAERSGPSRSSGPARTSSGRSGEFRSGASKSRAGSDGPSRGDTPVKKERWRNSFTGKNKGRPKPKAK